jgi:hypothetical protein
VARWDDPSGGGITTQGRDLNDLQRQITEAVAVHFDEGASPQRIRLRFIHDPQCSGRLMSCQSHCIAVVGSIAEILRLGADSEP